MIKRFIIAIILLVLVCGGLVGFNLFRDKAIQDFFATMQRPAVAVSTTEVKAVSWEPEIRAIGTVNAAKGVDLPYSCAGGMCATCRCKVVEGSAEMDANFSLEPWETEAGFILSCQARPTSVKLVLDYDAV